MWIFTDVGFFSIVQKEKTDYLTVRARVRKDLDKLRAKYMPQLSDTIEHEGSDYPYRATITHDDFALGMARLSYNIDYDNFKSMVYRKFGEYREAVYAKVWSVMFSLQKRGGK
jgi:hypothetical protein